MSTLDEPDRCKLCYKIDKKYRRLVKISTNIDRGYARGTARYPRADRGQVRGCQEAYEAYAVAAVCWGTRCLLIALLDHILIILGLIPQRLWNTRWNGNAPLCPYMRIPTNCLERPEERPAANRGLLKCPSFTHAVYKAATVSITPDIQGDKLTCCLGGTSIHAAMFQFTTSLVRIPVLYPFPSLYGNKKLFGKSGLNGAAS